MLSQSRGGNGCIMLSKKWRWRESRRDKGRGDRQKMRRISPPLCYPQMNLSCYFTIFSFRPAISTSCYFRVPSSPSLFLSATALTISGVVTRNKVTLPLSGNTFQLWALIKGMLHYTLFVYLEIYLHNGYLFIMWLPKTFIGVGNGFQYDFTKYFTTGNPGVSASVIDFLFFLNRYSIIDHFKRQSMISVKVLVSNHIPHNVQYSFCPCAEWASLLQQKKKGKKLGLIAAFCTTIRVIKDELGALCAHRTEST